MNDKKQNPTLYLNVFHLIPFVNKVFRCFKVGGYHSQLSIDDKDEVFFGFSNLPGSGIKHLAEIGQPPPELAGAPLFKKFKLGKSVYNYSECQKYIREFENNPDWLAEHYHMFYHNCNSFTYEICQVLLDKPTFQKKYPNWIRNGEIRVGRFIFRTSINYIIEFLTNQRVLIFGTPVGQDGYQDEFRKYGSQFCLQENAGSEKNENKSDGSDNLESIESIQSDENTCSSESQTTEDSEKE
ncbi:hypothetical protein TRFO_30674 [Tritrichomonas foetus]|uniref:PPPDE domain-containing protein n=1 Tax=Tritrichomonas foetus TaxID=1144522 RepID=A0A1J4JT13_9EUKA|nr:hypothetical protein TRFO_30674 [Tritrichomonas foetus]|eukprot:OHT02255.1 hypothetical protein TRFO_30674 [Tritrichomonas foetus]